MRRGPLAWSPSEVSEAEFGRRVAGLRQRFDQAGIDVLLVYTNFARTAAVSHLTNMVPFWAEAVFVIPRSGKTVLVSGLPKRDLTVVRPTGCFDDLVCDPDARSALIAVLTERGLAGRRIGIVDPDSVPAAFFAALAAIGDAPVDASGLFDGLDDDGSSRNLQMRAADIARNAIGAASISLDRAQTLVAAIELQARLAGAEEVQVLVAPDLDRGDRLRRVEVDSPLGERFAVCVSLAYKGHWLRLGRSLSRGTVPTGWDEAARRIPAVAAALAGGGDIASQVAQAFGEANTAQLASWSVEALSGASPLALVAASTGGEGDPLRPSQLAVFSAWIDLPEGPFFAAATARVGEGLLAA